MYDTAWPWELLGFPALLSTGSRVELSSEDGVCLLRPDMACGTMVGWGLVLPARAFSSYPMARLQGGGDLPLLSGAAVGLPGREEHTPVGKSWK